MWPLLFSVALGATCGDDTVAELEGSMSAVLDANRDLDEVGFARSSKLMDAAVSCLDQPVTNSTLTRIHHVMALRAFVDGHTNVARAHLAGLRAADPNWVSPFPDGHPFTKLWTQTTDVGSTEAVGRIWPKQWVVDGEARNEVPTARSFLVQVRDEDGAIQLTRYLASAEALPDFGQDEQANPQAVPFMFSLRVLGTGRAFGQQQRSDSAPLEAQAASTIGPGGTIAFRATPSARFGAEASLSLLSDDDVIAADTQPLGVEGHAVALVGGNVATTARQWVFVAGRAGVMTDTVRAWPRAGRGVDPGAWRVWGPSLGAEAGLRGARSALDLTLDGAFAGLTPWRADLRLGGTTLLTDALGLRAQALARTAGQALFDDDEQAGSVVERELRLSAGIDLVF